MTTDALHPRNRGYYRNSLKAWRARLLKERRLSAARHERMKAMGHPDADDQGLCVRHLEQMLEVIDSAERVADALNDDECYCDFEAREFFGCFDRSHAAPCPQAEKKP